MIDLPRINGQAFKMHLKWLARITHKIQWDILAMLSGLIIMNSGGFGSRNLYESTAAICSGIAVFISIREK